MKKITVAGLVFVFLAGVGIFVSSAAKAYAATIYVNVNATSSGNGTQAAPFPTIQAAVDAASPNDTISVATGTYNEAVSVTKNLTITGADVADTIIKAPATLPAEGAIVNATGTGVSLDISGLTVEGPGPSTCGSLMSGVFISGGAYADIHDMTIKDITDSALSGCQNGRAVLIGWGHGSGIPDTTGSATVNNVTISDYQKAGVEVSGTGSSATIVNNTITGAGSTNLIAQNGIEVTFGASGDVSDNTVTDNSYTGSDYAAGILLYAPATSTLVGSNTVSGNQFGLWTNGEGSFPSINISAISGNIRNAVADTTGWSAPASVSVDASLSGTKDANGGDIISGGGVVGYSAFKDIQDGLNAVASGGTVNVAAGTYSGDLSIPTSSITLQGTGSVVLNLGAGYGINLDNPPMTAADFTMSGFTVNASANTTYALKAYDADGLTLSNDTFNGQNAGGGVDINTTKNVTFNNVTVNGFHKNGFAITSAYEASDTPASGVAFSNVTSTDNGWAGIAFYNVGGAGGAGNIGDVVFTGTDYIDGNSQGIFVEGDSDADYASHATTPAYTVTTDGTTLDITHVAFGTGNVMDIVNYQTAPVNALGTTFGGATGNMMSSAQHSAEDGKIFDKLDIPSQLGLVTYYIKDTMSPTAQFTVTPPTYVNSNFNVSGTASDNVALKGVLFDVRDPADTTGNSWRAGCTATSTVLTFGPGNATATISCTINTANLTEGRPYILRIHAGDYAGYGGGEEQSLIVDRTKPSAQITAPVQGNTVGGSFTVTGTATDTLSGVDHVVIYIEHDPWSAGGYAVKAAPAIWNATSGTFSYDASGIPDGVYDVKALVYDKAGNLDYALSGNKALTITVSNAVPSLTITVPAADGDYATGTYDFTAVYANGTSTSFDWAVRTDPSCNSGTVAGNVDGFNTTSTFSSSTFSATLDTTGWSDGTYCFVVNDLHGLRTTRSFTVDNTAPAAPALVSPSNGATVNGASVTQAWSDSDLTIDHFIYESFNNASATSLRWQQTFPSSTLSKTATNVATSTYWWRVEAFDAAGNESVSPLWKLNVSNAPFAELTVAGVPSSTTITQSLSLVPETNGRAPSSTVAAAVAGVTPITGLIRNIGNGTSTAIILKPINGGSHLQFWLQGNPTAQDLNVLGWGAPSGETLAPGHSLSGAIYPVSDQAGTYTVEADVVDASATSAVLASTTITITVNPRPVTYVTTDGATNISQYDATLNGTNGDYAATGHSFWVSTSTFSTSSTAIPAGVYSTPDFKAIAANTSFSASLSSLTTDAVVHGQVAGTMPAIQPNTTYYYVAWSNANGSWHPGAMQSFTTAPLDADDTLSALSVSNGTLAPSFDPAITPYVVTLPFNTTVVPMVTATTTDPNATLSISQATSTTGTATVAVTAQDGTTAHYTVQFALAPATSSFVDVILDVDNSAGGTATSSDFTVKVVATNPSTSTFPGSAAGTVVTIDPNSNFDVNIVSSQAHYTESRSGDCHIPGGLPGGNSAICTITETYKPIGNFNSVIVGSGIGGSTNGGGQVLGASISGNDALEEQVQLLEQQLVTLLQQYLSVLQSETH